MTDFHVVIPARHASTRLPGKPLLLISGKPMVVRVAEQAAQSGAQQIWIATDHHAIANVVHEYGFKACLTKDSHASGTDRIAEVVALTEVGQSLRFTIALPRSLSKYIAPKGSVCVDGVSLTVNAVEGDSFEVNIIPHTLHETTLGAFTVGRRVNIEVDMIARYIERLLLGEDTVQKGRVSYELLARHGFINE